MINRSLLKLFFVVLTGALCLLARPEVGAANPPLLPSAQPATKAEQKPSAGARTPETAVQIRERLDSARAEVARLEAGTGAAPGASGGEFAERRDMLQQVVRAYEGSLESLKRLEDVRARRKSLGERAASWQGFDEPPPYSIVFVDELRDQLAPNAARASALESQQALLRQEEERMLEEAGSAEQQLRQAKERLEAAADSPDASRLAEQRELAAARSRFAQARLTRIKVEQQLAVEELAEERLALEFARRRIIVAEAKVRFAEEDMEQIRTKLEAERRDLARQSERLIGEDEARRKALTALDARLETERAAAARPGEAGELATDRVKHLELERELAALRVQATSMRIDMLKVIGNVVQAKQTLWEHRYELNRSPNPEVKLRASQAVEWTSRNLKNVKTYLEQRLSVVTTRVGEESARLGTGLAPVEEELLSKRKAAYLEQAEALQRLQSAIGAVQVLADRTRLEIGETQRSQTWPERVADVWAQIASYAKSAWHLELMAVEDTIEVDGQKVTGTRSVTVGKVVRALLLFAIGFYASVLVGRLGERVGIGYFGMDAGAARLLRSWLQVIGLTVLFVLVLVWVKIPLTIFAFLGGAVAIGIGFGMQTLFKNLISGLMVLGERPFRLGDIVDVGGMRGTITNIGVRSSTIRDVNGIETLVPNSTFLEQNLTNWTYSSRQVRFVVRVGVAYGSPVQRVRELLAECADRHGLVLDDPPAEVLFEDFGADALLFALHYWVDLKPSTNSPQIASDLRYMIAKAFATEGIAIAFPQRDVHLDTAAPLRVEIVREAGREGEKPAGGVEPVKLRDTAS